VARQRNQLRITGGEFGSRRLHLPDAKGLRPTADRVRETLFNWLQGELTGAKALDLYAGSGALGFEALSRGAAHVTFVEKTRNVADQLRENIELLNCQSKAGVVNTAAERFLSQTESAFDVVFLDPPFADGLLGKAIQTLEEKALLSPQAWVYLEQDSAHDWPDMPENWAIHREGDAGQAAFRLMKRNG